MEPNGDIDFKMRQQPGHDSWFENRQEKNAYAEMMRGMEKLRLINMK